MYVSVTGLKINNLYASMKFWLLTIPAFRAAQKADGILLCENQRRNGYQHPLTVWKTKIHMLAYVYSEPLRLIMAVRTASGVRRKPSA
jgi:hypothetical protein